MEVLSVSDIVVKELVERRQGDLHGAVDLIVACGDLPPEYLSELSTVYDVPLFYIVGNHDIRHNTQPVGCVEITGRIIHHKGTSFLGFSGSRWYNGNPNQFHEHEMRSQIRRLWFQLWRLKRLDVVITHAPPRRIHDAEDRCHKGFNCYHALINRHSPRYFIHGHIHRQFEKESDRITMVGETAVVNSYGFHRITI